MLQPPNRTSSLGRNGREAGGTGKDAGGRGMGGRGGGYCGMAPKRSRVGVSAAESLGRNQRVQSVLCVRSGQTGPASQHTTQRASVKVKLVSHTSWWPNYRSSSSCPKASHILQKHSFPGFFCLSGSSNHNHSATCLRGGFSQNFPQVFRDFVFPPPTLLALVGGVPEPKSLATGTA